MKRLIILALIAYAAWYGWNHRDVLLSKAPAHHALIRNDTGEGVVRLRLRVGGQTYVREAIADGQVTDIAFRVNGDSKFDLTWEWESRLGEGRWSGGSVAEGPMVLRHIITLRPQGGVVYETQNL